MITFSGKINFAFGEYIMREKPPHEYAIHAALLSLARQKPKLKLNAEAMAALAREAADSFSPAKTEIGFESRIHESLEDWVSHGAPPWAYLSNQAPEAARIDLDKVRKMTPSQKLDIANNNNPNMGEKHND
jgi:hypothetical protein